MPDTYFSQYEKPNFILQDIASILLILLEEFYLFYKT